MTVVGALCKAMFVFCLDGHLSPPHVCKDEGGGSGGGDVCVFVCVCCVACCFRVGWMRMDLYYYRSLEGGTGRGTQLLQQQQ